MISEFFTIEETLPPFAICREDGVAVLGDPDFGEALFEAASRADSEEGQADREAAACQILQRGFRLGQNRYMLRVAIPLDEIVPGDGTGEEDDDLSLFTSGPHKATVEELARPLFDMIAAVLGYTVPTSVERRSYSVQLLYEEFFETVRKEMRPVVKGEGFQVLAAYNTACVDREGFLMALGMAALAMIQTGAGRLHFSLDAPRPDTVRYTLRGERSHRYNEFLRALLPEMGRACGFRVAFRRGAVEVMVRLEQESKLFLRSEHTIPASVCLRLAMALFGRPYAPAGKQPLDDADE